MILPLAASFAALSASALATPVSHLDAVPRSEVGDAPFSVPASNLTAAVTCPNGIKGAAGGVVYLIHGTGSTGNESWSLGPYAKILPTYSPGYDVCWVTFPGRCQGDAQVTSEYVAYNIKQLAKKSKTGKVNLVGHSQGNLNIQWALNYWPSMRQYVDSFVSLAGDFHGTDEGGPLCAVTDLLALGGDGCTPATVQQSVGSKFLGALLKRGNKALVRTTSVYTLEDEVIQNELGPNATSILPGAYSIALQDLKACGPLHPAEHFSMIIDPGAFRLAIATFENKSSPPKLDQSYCFRFLDGTGASNDTFAFLPGIVKSVALDVSSFATQPKGGEPALRPYVCKNGDAKKCASK